MPTEQSKMTRALNLTNAIIKILKESGNEQKKNALETALQLKVELATINN
ncbi:hypothetical protein [Actinomyces sp. HMSC065F12]|jgi:hypothetical protein|nr:hypothetical protein [Actinomyces sp. HMSC065F12]MDU7730893.1 hypothetical protein [Actinomyces sp.]